MQAVTADDPGERFRVPLKGTIRVPLGVWGLGLRGLGFL